MNGKLEKFNYQITGSNEKSDGISSTEGPDSFDKDGWEKQNISANVGYSKGRIKASVNGGWNHNLYQYDEGAFADGQYRGDDQQLFVGGNVGYQYENGNLVWNEKYDVRLNSKFKNKPCLDCRILPICNGGCSQQALEHIGIDYCVNDFKKKKKTNIVKDKFLYTINN